MNFYARPTKCILVLAAAALAALTGAKSPVVASGEPCPAAKPLSASGQVAPARVCRAPS